MKLFSQMFFCWTLLSISTALASEVVTFSVAEVGGHVVSSREVTLSSLYDRWALAGRSADGVHKVPSADWSLAPKSDTFKQVSSSLVLDSMVAREAEGFSAAEVSAEDQKKETEAFKTQMSSVAAWKKLDLGEDEIARLVRTKMLSKSFLKFKTDSAGVIVTDQEVKAFYDKNRLKFGNLPVAEFKESIREVMAKKALEERLKEWFDVLKRKYRVRILGQI